MTIDEAFAKFTVYVKTKKYHSVKCKKRLWQVSAPTKELALAEARHYFIQYYTDGEYND